MLQKLYILFDVAGRVYQQYNTNKVFPTFKQTKMIIKISNRIHNCHQILINSNHKIRVEAPAKTFKIQAT